MKQAPRIEAIMIDEDQAIFEGGLILPITDYFDEYGNACEREDATGAVAGNDEYGWIAFDVSSVEVTIH